MLLFGDQKISGKKSVYLSFQSIIVVFQMIPFLLQSFHFRFENLKFLLFIKIFVYNLKKTFKNK